MSKADLFTARWHLATGKPVPGGGPLESLYEVLTPILGPMPGTLPVPDPGPVTPPPPGPVPVKKVKVAVVIGHNARAAGADVLPPLDLSEFAFNSAVSEKLLALSGGTEIEMKRFFREYSSAGYAAEIDRCYGMVNLWKPDFCVEMHFNGGGGNYAMMIVAKGSLPGVTAGAAMLEVISRDLGIPIWTNGTPRGISQLSRGDRGGRSVWAAGCPCVLTEPFFGDHAAHAARVAEIGFDGMAAIYLRAITQALKAIGKL
jgi:hypothetical protein